TIEAPGRLLTHRLPEIDEERVLVALLRLIVKLSGSPEGGHGVRSDADAGGDDALPGGGARREGWLGRPPVAGHRRAPHDAAVLGRIPRAPAVKDAAVVPHDEIPLPPAVLVDAVGLRSVSEEVVEQAA